MKKILFVCLGNICRSPLAQGIAQSLIDRYKLDIEVDSAGTSNYHSGEAPCAGSQKIARINNIDISNLHSRPVKVEDFESFDYIVAMDDANVRDLKNFGAKNVIKLGDYMIESSKKGADVPDPYAYTDFTGFEVVFDMINECVENFFHEEFDLHW